MSCQSAPPRPRPAPGASRALTVALAVLVLLLVTQPFSFPLAFGQEEEQLRVTSVVTNGWPDVEATVTIVGADGQPVTSLTQSNFNARSGEVPLPVKSVTTTSDPGVGIAVVLTFDVSGSMAGPPLDQAKLAGRALLDQLGPTDQAAVLAFADQPTLVQGFTADKDSLGRAIDSLQAGGNTALYAAVQQSVETAKGAPLPRRAVVLLSDGVDFGTSTTVDPQQTLDLVSGSGTLFLTIGLGGSIDAAYLGEVAARGRGQFLPAPAPGDLGSVYRATADILRQQYVLTLDATALHPQSQDVALHIEATIGAAVIGGDATMSVPAAFLATVTAVTTPPPSSAPASSPQPFGGTGGGSSSALIAAVLIGGLVIAGVGGLAVLLVRRRRDRGGLVLEPEARRFGREPSAGDYPEIQRAVEDIPSGAWLELPEGKRVPLGERAITIGSSRDCAVYLPNESAQSERARIWRRDGRYMLHNISPMGTLRVAGRPATWVILEDGDEISLGSQTVIFREPPQQ